MFYQCPKCKSYWQHPITKCPNCFVAVKRMRSNKAKVVGVSKVSIPTLMHPTAPYFVLILEDENKNKWAHKSIKEYKMGDEVCFEPDNSPGTVAIWRVKYDILEAIEKVVELLGGIKISQDSKIIILPTLVSPVHSFIGENTNPQVLDAMIKFLLQTGAQAKNIKVAGQSFNEIPIEISAGKSQFLKICAENKVDLLDLAKTELVKQTADNFNFEMSAELFNQDLIINLPTLNLHPKLGVSGATENLFKFLSKRSYLALKYLFAGDQVFAKVNQALPKNILTVGEAMNPQKKNKLTAFLSFLLAGYDMMNMDRVFTEICLEPDFAQKIKIENIPIAGRKIKEMQFNIESI